MAAAQESILTRTRKFALRVVRLYCELPKNALEQTLGKQLLRSGTSVGAHIHEGRRSRTNIEMISKIEVALQELEESKYWIELIAESGIFPRTRLMELQQEIEELISILVTSVKHIKRMNLKAPKSK